MRSGSRRACPGKLFTGWESGQRDGFFEREQQRFRSGTSRAPCLQRGSATGTRSPCGTGRRARTVRQSCFAWDAEGPRASTNGACRITDTPITCRVLQKGFFERIRLGAEQHQGLSRLLRDRPVRPLSSRQTPCLVQGVVMRRQTASCSAGRREELD